MSNNHTPVMLKEVKSFIPNDKELNLIDATFGGGGYSKHFTWIFCYDLEF